MVAMEAREASLRSGPGADWTSMPQFFKQQGYWTTSAGKVFHDGQDDPQSWVYPSNQTACASFQANVLLHA